VQVPSPDSSTYKSPSGGTPPLDQTKAPSSERVHDEDTNASAMNRSPVATTVNQKQISGTTGPQEADRINAASSKQGSKPLEVIIVGGRKVDDAGMNVHGINGRVNKEICYQHCLIWQYELLFTCLLYHTHTHTHIYTAALRNQSSSSVNMPSIHYPVKILVYLFFFFPI
jgi:hypothetical protein